jgi:MFS family permease
VESGGAGSASGPATWALPFILGLAVLDRSISAVELGVVLAARTAGFLVAVPVAGVLADRYPRRHILVWAGLVAASAPPLIALGLLLPVPAPVVVGAYVVAGLGIELFNVPWFTGTRREVEPRMLARVSSLDFLLSYGPAPVGLALIAPAIDHFGARPVLAVCAVVCFATPAAAALVPSTREFRTPSPRSGGPDR